MSYRRLRIPLAAWIFVSALWAVLLWNIGGNVLALVRWMAEW